MSNANFNTVCADSNQLASATAIYAEQSYDMNDSTPTEGYIYPILYPLPLYYDVYSAVTPVEYNGTTFYYYQQYAVPSYSYSYVTPENSIGSDIQSVRSQDSTNILQEQVTSELSLEVPIDDVITLNVEGELENDDTSDKSEEILESAARPDKISCTVEIDNREGDHEQVNTARMDSSYDNMRENEAHNDLYQDSGQENEFCIDPYSDSFDEKDYNTKSCHGDPIENEFWTACSDSFDEENYNTNSFHGDPIENDYGTACSDSSDEKDYNTESCHDDPIENEFGTAGIVSFDKEGYNTESCHCDPTENESGTACSDSSDEEDYNTESCHDDRIENEFGTAGSDSFDKEGYNTESCHCDPTENESGTVCSDSSDEKDYNTESCHDDPIENEFGTAGSDSFDKEGYNTESCHCDPTENEYGTACSDSSDEEDYNTESCHDDHIENEFGTSGSDSFDKEGYNTESCHCDPTENESGKACSDKSDEEDYNTESCHGNPIENEFGTAGSDSFDEEGYNTKSCHDDPIENEFGTAGSDSFDEEDYNAESCHGDPAENEFGTASSDEDLDEIYSNSVRCSKLSIEDPLDEVIPLKVEEEKEQDDVSKKSEQTLESTLACLDKDSCTEKKEKWEGDNKEIDADMIVSSYDKLSDNDAQKDSYQYSRQEIEFCNDPFKDSFDDEGFNIESGYGDAAEKELRTASSDDDIVEQNSNLEVRCGKVFKYLRHFKREIEILPTIYEEDEPPDGDEELPETTDEVASSQTSKNKRFKRLRRWFSRLTRCCRKSRKDSPG